MSRFVQVIGEGLPAIVAIVFSLVGMFFIVFVGLIIRDFILGL